MRPRRSTFLHLILLLGSPLLCQSTAPSGLTTNSDLPPARRLYPRGGLGSSGSSPGGPPVDTKYFHEPPGTLEHTHYDLRFYQGLIPYAEHRAVLRDLIRSYIVAFRDTMALETWLAHGSLLGWWWNGRVMPWDYDVDVQVSVQTLRVLAAKWNGTRFGYYYGDNYGPDGRLEGDGADEGVVVQLLGEGEAQAQAATIGASEWSHRAEAAEASGKGVSQADSERAPRRVYLLDVNPHFADRGRGDGSNVIDARWIDVASGLFIDVTGLAERDPWGGYYGSDGKGGGAEPGVWSCKNFHRYRTQDLYPMRETEFEGVRGAKVPYAFEKVLMEEYGGRALVATEWMG